MNAYLDVQQIKAQIGLLRHDYPELADDAQLLEDTLEGETSFREVLAQLVRLERQAKHFAAAIYTQECSLKERRERFLAQREKYLGMMQSLMDAAGQKKVTLPEATISIAQNRAGCIVTDETALPDEFVKIERIPKKTEILAALLAGERIPGAEMKNRGTHVLIRT